MRKDIQIPEVKGVYMAAVKEFNETHRTHDWNVYLINDLQQPLEMVLIVSNGYGEKQVTSQMRHKLDVLPAKAYAKIEFLEDRVLQLTNAFSLTYFLEGKLFEKKFVFEASTIQDAHAEPIPVMPGKGVLAR